MADKKDSLITRIINKTSEIINYCWKGVWQETRDTTGIRLLKVANLSVRSFLDRDLQTKSMSLTYSTVLAIVLSSRSNIRDRQGIRIPESS